MTITIYEGYDKSYVMLGCKREEFQKKYGHGFRVRTANLYRELSAITEWVNNELGEECLFEIY